MTGTERNRADDSLLTLLGDLPELVRNLITAEIDAAKSWVSRTSKNAGIGSVWFVVALFFLFWLVPMILTFTVIGLASWMPLWLAALATLGVLLVCAAITGILGWLQWRKALRRKNPASAVAEDIRLVKEARDERP